MRYSKERHLYLLKYSQKLEKKGTNLYYESRSEADELLQYSVMMVNYFISTGKNEQRTWN